MAARVQGPRRQVGPVGPDDGGGVGIRLDLSEQVVVVKQLVERRPVKQRFEVDDATLDALELQLDDVAAEDPDTGDVLEWFQRTPWG